MGFLLYYKNFLTLNNKNYILHFILLFCLLVTLKYHMRFNVERKFHELNNTTIQNSINASKINKKLSGLNWKSPYFADPKKEVNIINTFILVLNKDKANKMIITEYNFFSSILGKKFYSPSRTYDSISYPKKNSKYFKKYKHHLINIIKKNKIKKIYIFQPATTADISSLVYAYIDQECFKKSNLDKYIIKLEILSCEAIK